MEDVSAHQAPPPTASPRRIGGRIALALALALLVPMLTLYWLVTPLSGLTLGNDYPVYSIQQQREVAYSLHYGSFPVYAPGLAGGRTAAALTLAQTWHPVTHLARVIPGYWDGHALTINTFLRVASLGLCQLFAYLVLRRMTLSPVPALLISFVTVYNMRMLDHFRYGPALDNHVGYLLLSLALIYRYMRPGGIASAAAIVAASYLLAVGGHPQIGYLGFLGAAIVALAAPSVLGTFGAQFQLPWRQRMRYWAVSLGLVAAGVLIAAPYALPFYLEFLADNAVRVGNDYQWSLAFSDTWGGALRSFFAPLDGDVHGAFGGSSLIVMAAVLPLLYFFGHKVPAAILWLFAASVAIFLVSLGDATPLHYLFWKGVPLADTFRVPGRIDMALLVPLMLLLAWLFRPVAAGDTPPGTKDFLTPLAIVALLGLVWLIVANLWLTGLLPESGPYTPGAILQRPGWVSVVALMLGLASLALTFAYGLRSPLLTPGRRLALGAALCAVVAGQVTITLRFATWIVPAEPQQTLAEMDAEKRRDFRLYAVPGAGMESVAVVEQMQRSILEPRLARFYRKLVPAKDADAAWTALATTRKPDEAVVVGLGPDELPSLSRLDGIPDSVRLVRATFNEINLEVMAGSPGLLAFNYPYTERWVATVDGQPARVYRANGNESSVLLSAGKHEVGLRYRSLATNVGVMVSTGILMVMGFLFSLMGLQGRARYLGLSVSLLLPPALALFWFHSLYNGSAMPAAYEWTSAELPHQENLAYGKPTVFSSSIDDQIPYNYYAGRAVDGNTREQGFLTRIGEPNPWWQVDLGAEYLISRIQLHDVGIVSAHFPVEFWLSADGLTFQRAGILSSPQRSGTWSTDISGVPARYLRVQSRRNGPFSFAEIEVFGSAEYQGQ